MRRLPSLSLFLQVLGLVIATLLVGQIAAVVIVMTLPPPVPEFYSVEDVVSAVRGSQPMKHRDGQPLMRRLSSTEPQRGLESGRKARFRTALSAALGLDPSRIVVARSHEHIFVPGFVHAQVAPPPDMADPPIGSPVDSRGLRLSPDQPLLVGHFLLGVRQDDGRWLIVEPQSTFGMDPWRVRLLLALFIAALAVSPLAWWFTHRLAAPIAALAVGAQRLGRDPHAPPLDVHGSAEVAAAVVAFNEMQQRLNRYVADRTALVGAIAHDLRTPLTRLRFRIESAPDALRAKLTGDVEEMEAMIAATMAFVSDATRERKTTRLDIASIVETVVDELAETGAASSLVGSERVVVDGDAVALKRLVVNLVENALKFGVVARAQVTAHDGMAVIVIDDDGPGVPEADLERAFDPFQRLETSRSRETGGIGLGLATVRAVARGHGGDVLLSNRPGGGLRATVSLPLAIS